MLLAVFLTRGNDSLTKTNYERFQNLSKNHPTHCRENDLPDHSSLTRYMYPFMKAEFLPKIHKFQLRRTNYGQEQIAPFTASTYIGAVLPCTWALLDVRSFQFYSNVYSRLDSHRVPEYFEKTLFIDEHYSKRTLHEEISVLTASGAHSLNLGDHIRVQSTVFGTSSSAYGRRRR